MQTYKNVWHFLVYRYLILYKFKLTRKPKCILLHNMFASALHRFAWFIIAFKIISTQPEWNSIFNKTHSKYKRDTNLVNSVSFCRLLFYYFVLINFYLYLITICVGKVKLIVWCTHKIKTLYWHVNMLIWNTLNTY